MKQSIDNLGYAVLLSLNYGTSTGSGFHLQNEDIQVLITAKHVLFNEQEKIRCDILQSTNQSPRGKLEEAKIIQIDMKKARVLFSKKDDLAIVLLARKDTSINEFIYENYIEPQQEGNVPNCCVDISTTKLLEEIGIANDVYLIGYPTSLFFQSGKYFDVSKPLLRKGVIAGLNLQENTFIIDCPAYYGNSGAPIIEVCDDGVFRVIGLVSRYIPFIVEWRNSREAVTNTEYLNSGYSVCVPMDVVRTLLSQDFL